MESTTLLEIYSNLNSWPSTDAELDSACAWLTKLSGAPFAALLMIDAADSQRLVFRSNDSVGGDQVREFLRRQTSQISAEKGQIRQIQIARDSHPIPPLGHASYLSWVPVTVEPAQAKRDRLWVFVAGSKVLSIKDEVLLLSFSQHLRHLAEKHQLESMVRLRNQFLSIASHELKTPLTSIYGMLQLQERMLRLKKDDLPAANREKQHGFLKMVIRQVERLNELIDGLLDVSRIQAGRFAVDPTEMDASAMVQDLVSTRLTVIANDAGVRLNVDAPERLMAWLDPVRAEEVVTNLVMNAIRFSPEGGAVWLKLAIEDGSMRLTVRDQGPAVPNDDRERIFQPFERAQRTSRFGGLGLGLFISRQIAQLHGGNVSLVESVPGKGNVFEAYFPIRGVSLVSA